ncbi:MAG TPA: AAA family ATPase [Acidimicrobiales bacterium]|nr:AAA family ATPase [Acidimicrobiales bacterium]
MASLGRPPVTTGVTGDVVPLVGRRAERAVLRELIERARDGAGGVLVVEGEPGIGKTRLVTELADDARRRGLGVFAGAADEMQGERPFGPFVEALGLDAGSPDRDRAQLGRLVLGDDRDAPSARTDDVGFRIVEAIVGLVERLAAATPVLLVLEDLHWAGPSSIRALQAVGRRALAALPVAVVATLRPFPRNVDLDLAIDDLDSRGARRLALDPLSPEDTCALAVAAGARPTEALSRQLRATGGNPLLVIELVASTVAGTDADAIPPALSATVLRRLRCLPAATVEALKVASVLGRRFSVTQLAAVMGRSPVELLSGLEDAIAARVLGEDDGELAFRHQLIRDAVYEDLAVPLRRGLHREVARVLESNGAPLGQVADHLLAGARPGDNDAVAGLAEAARSVAPRSPHAAVKLLERAMELGDPEASGADELAVQLAPLLIQTGRPLDATDLTRRVLARGPAPAVEAALRRALGEVLWMQGWLEAAADELEAAGRVAGAEERERMGALALAANLRLFLGVPSAAEGAARELLAEGERLGDDFVVCLSLQTLAVAADAEGHVGEAIGLARRATATARDSAEPRVGHLHPQLFLGLILLDGDRLDEAAEVLQEGRRRAEARGTVAWLPLYHCALAMRCLFEGSLDDGLAEIDTGLALAEEVGTRLYVPLLHGMAAWVAAHRGELGAAEDLLQRAADEFIGATSPAWRAQASVALAGADARWPLEWGLWVSALLEAAAGDESSALSRLEDAWTAAAPLRYFLSYRLFAPDVVRAAVRAGRRELGSGVVADVEEGARRSGATSAAAAALRCRALFDGDADGLVSAAAAYRVTPHRMELAFTCEDAGLALAAEGRGREAVELLEEGLAVFDDAGATVPAARAAAALRTLGVRHRRSGRGRRGQTGWESLTPTEMRVARLAAEGLTNREIGERLFVSRRTVETHLAHAFAKLGLSSRAQLAAEVARRGT